MLTKEAAIAHLKWHAENSTQGKLATSCKHDHEWEASYRFLFGQAPTYAELMQKIQDKIAHPSEQDDLSECVPATKIER